MLAAVAWSCPDGEFRCGSGDCVPVDVICDATSDCPDGSEFCDVCDFEHNSCGWNDTSKGLYRWSLVRANETSRPTHDHSTGSLAGHVMYIDGNHSQPMSVATLERSVTSGAALACQLSFWYQIQDITVRSDVTVKLLRGHGETILWSTSETRKDSWENATAFIGNQPGGYKLQLSVKAPFLTKYDVMLDDIAFKHCREADVPAGFDQLTCDFEKDTCSWYHDNTKGLLWKRIQGFWDGPGNDHTTGEGYFMFVAPRNTLYTSLTARLMSYPQPVAKVICVSFWYRIFGTSVGSLRFITKVAGGNETLVWMRHGTQGNKWRFADLTFNSMSPIQ